MRHQPFSIRMWGGYHLREVNHSNVVLVVQHKVELVKVSMNQAVIGQFDYELHELTVQGWWILQLMYLTPERERQYTESIWKTKSRKSVLLLV